MIDPDWSRMINASVNSYFATASSLTGIIKYFEGQEINFSGDKWLEVRVDGPNFEEGPGQIDVSLNLSVMLTVKKSTQGYDIHTLSGIIQSLFISIPVYSDIDTAKSEILFCLKPKGRVRTIPWGDMTVGPTSVRVINHSIEGAFTGEL